MIGDASELVGPYHYVVRLVLQRVGLVMAIGALVILCLSSAMLAAVVGVMTAAIVAVDMLALAPRRAARLRLDHHTPDKLSVDLSRRQ